MTTGRINQVTTVRNALRRLQGLATDSLAGAFARLEFVNEFPKGILKGKATTTGLPSAPESVQTSPTVRGQTTLFPDLTKFKRTSPCLQRDRDHGLRWGLPATGYAFFERCAAVTADPRVVIWLTGLAIGKQSTSFSHCKLS